MEDIAPELLEKIQSDFESLLQEISWNGSTYTEASEYAEAVGDALTEAFRRNLTPGTLPDRKLYWNIADRVVRPMLERDHQLVADAAQAAQQIMNKQAGIGLKAQRAPLDQDKVEGILNKLASSDDFEKVSWVLDEPVKTFSRSVVDDVLRKNINFQGRTGLRPRVIRKAERKCCRWCSNLAGVYEYPDVPKDVYRRHEHCRCSVEYDPGAGKKVQNVHTKRWNSVRENDNINVRKRVSNNAVRLLQSRDMANGPRNSPFRHITKEQEVQIRNWADELEIPQDILRFNEGDCTSFTDELVVINIRGDIYPSKYAENPNSILNARCALAHEYYGHFKHHPSEYPPGDWRDEFRASYSAAIDTPNLTGEERRMLMIDAYDRKKEAGEPIEYDETARRYIYGDD